ncbi:MAG: signal peptidase I [Eubacteriales bacterium]|nr:signal peptidase I [Eubacteriales bacterium]
MKKEILSWIGCFAVAIAAALFIVTFIGQRVRVDGRSMESTLQDGDNLICDKISYRFSDPERFDIVIIYPEENNKKDKWIKRIIGLPGEEVRIDTDGTIYIDGEKLEENYGKEVIEDPGMAIEPIQLGEDEYWVMGDNRNHSSDSRVIGPVTKDRILGKAFIRIYPFSKFGFIRHQ